MSNKSRGDSSLVKSVLALDNYLSELERVGAKINSTDMTSDFDVEYIQKLMMRFAECGQGVSGEVANLSTQLHEARARAEAIAQGVAGQAELWNIRKNEQNEKLEEFRILGEKVRELNTAISNFGVRRSGEPDERRSREADIQHPGFREAELAVVIEELQDLRKSARDSRMKTLEKNAESLAQSLQPCARSCAVESVDDRRQRRSALPQKSGVSDPCARGYARSRFPLSVRGRSAYYGDCPPREALRQGGGVAHTGLLRQSPGEAELAARPLSNNTSNNLGAASAQLP
jgi:hypothetical protein